MHESAATTLDWVRNFVVAHDLCPFAAHPLARGRVTAVACPEREPEGCFYWAGARGQEFLDQPPGLVETTLLVFPHALAGFGDFLDFVATYEDFLNESGADALLQLAHFHPAYRFADAPPDDPAHATNRAPYPTLQLLRTDSVARAVAAYGDTDRIWQRNAALLRARPELARPTP